MEEWQRRFLAAVSRYDSCKIPLKFMRSPIVKDAHARMDSSKIPSRPLGPGDVRVIDEALQALISYLRLLIAANATGGVVAKTAYGVFPHIFRWIAFVSPSSKNIGDDGSQDNTTPSFVNGEIVLGHLALVSVLRLILANVLLHEEGRRACLAQRDFIDVLLSVYTIPFPVGLSDALVLIAHQIIQGLTRLLEAPAHGTRIFEDIRKHDLEHPGVLLRTLVYEMETFFTYPSPAEEFVPLYFQLSARLLACDTVFHNYREGRGVKQIMKILSSTVGLPVGKEIPYARPIMVYWLSQLRRMVSSSHESILGCIKAGILVVLRDSMLDDEGNSRDAEWMAPAADFIRYVLTPAFVWPDVLHTLRQAIKERHISWDVERIRPLWYELSELCRRYEQYLCITKQLRAELRSLKWCHNGDWCFQRVEPSARGMCACGQVFYCSRACQRAHWRRGHRAQCRTRDEIEHLKLENPRVLVNHLERRYLRRLAQYIEGASVERLQCEVDEALLIDCTDGVNPKRTVFKDPLAPTRPPADLPRTYMKIRLGMEEGIVFTGLSTWGIVGGPSR